MTHEVVQFSFDKMQDDTQAIILIIFPHNSKTHLGRARRTRRATGCAPREAMAQFGAGDSAEKKELVELAGSDETHRYRLRVSTPGARARSRSS
jgi:hypothetical protein